MVARKRMVIGISLAVALAVTGCAGKARMSSSSMCAAHGGTYNTAAKSCSYTAQTKSAQQVCQAQGGYYDIGTDYCEIGN
jgi:hypothetical protein